MEPKSILNLDQYRIEVNHYCKETKEILDSFNQKLKKVNDSLNKIHQNIENATTYLYDIDLILEIFHPLPTIIEDQPDQDQEEDEDKDQDDKDKEDQDDKEKIDEIRP